MTKGEDGIVQTTNIIWAVKTVVVCITSGRRFESGPRNKKRKQLTAQWAVFFFELKWDNMRDSFSGITHASQAWVTSSILVSRTELKNHENTNTNREIVSFFEESKNE